MSFTEYRSCRRVFIVMTDSGSSFHQLTHNQALDHQLRRADLATLSSHNPSAKLISGQFRFNGHMLRGLQYVPYPNYCEMY